MEVGGNSQARGERTPQISDDEDETIIYCAFSEPESDSDAPRPRPDYNKPIQFVPARMVFQEPDGETNYVLERADAMAVRRRQRQAADAAAGIVRRPKITIRRAFAGAPRLKGPQIPSLFRRFKKRLPDQPSAL
ncbi:hypothetical protein ZWY2020_044932 [Hordeum vulgare]|nr:hypothetical protein ZWY2020_044932 [Hordeum vulgare]